MNADKLKIQKIESFLKQFQSYIALIIIVVVATLINIKDGENVFLSVPNLMNVLRAVSETGIIAIGMTMILILGDIDLSVGSIVGLVSTGCASLMVRNGLGMFPAVLLSLLIGGLYGLFNGLCVTKLKLQAFIVTLASWQDFGQTESEFLWHMAKERDLHRLHSDYYRKRLSE